MKRLQIKYIYAVLIIIASVLVYSNSFHVPFHFDDEANILRNPLIQKTELFLNPSIYCSKVLPQTEEENLCRFFRTRYFGYLTFFLNYSINGIDVTGYHMVNLGIHVICSLLIFIFIILTFQTPFLAEAGIKKYSYATALFSGLIFAVHPVQTQAVTYIVQRFASLATMLYLLSFVCYIKWRLLRDKRKQKIQAEGADNLIRTTEILFYLASIIAAVIAMKTKEIAFTLPLLLIIYEFVFFKEKAGKALVCLLPYILTLLIIPVTIIGFAGSPHFVADSLNEATNLNSSLSRWEYLFTEFRVIVTYLRLLVLPLNQNLDYDYPEYHYFTNPEVLSSFILLSLIFAASLYFILRLGNKLPQMRLIAFGIFWFFITLSVESSVIPIIDVIFEHRLYLPSAGIIVAFITLIFWSAEYYEARFKAAGKAAAALLVALTVIYGTASFLRNFIWQDHISLWEDVVKKSPGKARAFYTLGRAYHDRKQTTKAMENYLHALQLDPTFFEAYNNLGNLYCKSGNYEKAEYYFSQAISINPSSDRIYDNRARLYFITRQYDKAVLDFTTAISINPNQTKYYKDRGRAYAQMKQYQYAIEDFAAAIKIMPYDGELFALRGLAYSVMKDKSNAVSDFQKACNSGYSNACKMPGVERKRF